MITPNGVMDILKEYLEENPEIQKELDIESLNLNETYFQSIVQELADALYEAGGEATKSPGNLFAYSTAEEYSSWDYPIRTKLKIDGTNVVRGIITIDQASLRRDSLSVISSNSHGWSTTGEGITDIVALFTNGYSASNQVYGFWEQTYGGYVSGHTNGGSPGLAPNPFVSDLIDNFKAKYPDIIVDIKYPKAWHRG